MLKLDVEDAYGLKGKRSFVFRPNLNIVACSVGKGASSIVKALSLLAGETALDGAIHESTDTATIKLRVENEPEYSLILKRASGTPAVISARPLSDRALECVIVNENHPLYRCLDHDSVEAFITRAANLSTLVKQKADAEADLASAEALLRKATTAIESAGNVEKESREVELHIQKLKEKREEQKDLVGHTKEELSLEAKRQVEYLLEETTAQVNRARETIQDYQAKLKIKKEALVDKENALAKFNAESKIVEARKQIGELEVKKANDQAAKEKVARLVSLSSVLEALGHPEECPACALFSIHTDWTKIPDDIFIPTVKNFGEHEIVERARLDKRIDEHLRKLRDLKDLCRGAEDDQARMKERCNEARRDITVLTEKMNAAERELAKANTELHDLAKKKLTAENKAQGKLTVIEHDLGGLEERRKALRPVLEELRKAKATKDRAENELKTAKKTLEKVTDELNGGLRNARRVFNQTAKTLLRQIGFKDFKEVSIDENFQLRIVRGEEKGYVEAPSELSTSESTTLTILLAISAKETFFSSFPFFAIDTITTCYNISAHRRFIEFLGRELKCHVIVTLLMPNEQELKVLNEFPASAFPSHR